MIGERESVSFVWKSANGEGENSEWAVNYVNGENLEVWFTVVLVKKFKLSGEVLRLELKLPTCRGRSNFSA